MGRRRQCLRLPGEIFRIGTKTLTGRRPLLFGSFFVKRMRTMQTNPSPRQDQGSSDP
jgi:hypothetical protein